MISICMECGKEHHSTKQRWFCDKCHDAKGAIRKDLLRPEAQVKELKKSKKSTS